MTKKHFIALAAALAHAHTQAYANGGMALAIMNDLIVDIANLCASTNPNFDRARFLEACRK